MIAAIVVAILIPPFAFDGGNDNDLVAALAAYSAKPTVILAAPDGGSYKKCVIPEGREIDFQRRLRAYLKVEVPLTLNGGISPTAWPWGLVHKANEKDYRSAFKSRPAERIRLEDGLVSGATKKLESVTIDEIADLKFSKPLSIHRFYRGAELRLSAKKASEKSFLQAIASAMGAHLEDRGKDYFLDVDEKVYRLKAIEAWKLQLARTTKQRDTVLAADAEYMVELLTKTDNRTIKKAFQDAFQHRSVGTQFPKGTRLFQLAYHRVRTYLDQSSDDNVINLFRRVVDPNRPVWGIIRVDGSAKTLFYNQAGTERVTF